MNRIRIKSGRVIDPAGAVDRICDVHVAAGKVLGVGEAPSGFEADLVIDARDHIVCPGLVDLSVRLREPGDEHKATVASESRAAAASGITTLCCQPDTDPVIDTPAVAELIHQRALESGMARVEVLGALTQSLAGTQLAEMGALGAAGCLGVSNAGRAIADTEVMRRAMEYAATFDLTVYVRPEDPWLADGRIVHHGEISTRLGLPGIPEIAETIIVARELLLVEQTGARVHFNQLSTGPAVEMVRDAREHGFPVTADVAMHHLYLTEHDIVGFDAACHVRPPLRTVADRDRLRAGVADGTLTAVCSDHQPHERDAKLDPFALTAPGISGLDTLLPLALELVETNLCPLSTMLGALTHGPADILRLDRGRLAPGSAADICVLNPTAVWTLRERDMTSRGHNTPFLGRELKGRVTHTLVGGEIVYSLPRQARPRAAASVR